MSPPKLMFWKLNPQNNSVGQWSLMGDVLGPKDPSLMNELKLTLKGPAAMSSISVSPTCCLCCDMVQQEGPHQLQPLNLGVPGFPI